MNTYGMKILDFHAHFPVQRSQSYAGYSQSLAQKYGERKAKIIMENSAKYREEWRRKWGFVPPEDEVHSDEEQAERWIADIDTKGVSRVNFVMGGGNDNLSQIVKMPPDRFTGFANPDAFAPNAAEELERAVKKLGLRGFKMIASALERPIEDRAAYPLWE